MSIKLFLKCRPTGQIRGSNLRAKINGFAGEGDPTRMKPVSHESIEGGRSDRVGSGTFEISRVGSGRVRTLLIPHGSGRVKRLSNSRGSGHVNIPQTFRGSGRVS